MATLYTFKCCVTFDNGTPAMTVEVEAPHAPMARQIAEARYCGKCRSANMVSGSMRNS